MKTSTVTSLVGVTAHGGPESVATEFSLEMQIHVAETQVTRSQL